MILVNIKKVLYVLPVCVLAVGVTAVYFGESSLKDIKAENNSTYTITFDHNNNPFSDANRKKISDVSHVESDYSLYVFGSHSVESLFYSEDSSTSYGTPIAGGASDDYLIKIPVATTADSNNHYQLFCGLSFSIKRGQTFTLNCTRHGSLNVDDTYDDITFAEDVALINSELFMANQGDSFLTYTCAHNSTDYNFDVNWVDIEIYGYSTDNLATSYVTVDSMTTTYSC
jgi:hypothetical protein